MVNNKYHSPLMIPLRILSLLIPTDYFRTVFYLNCIKKPRALLRELLFSFYRMDHIYDVLKESKNKYAGNFSILEFGVGEGHSFTKMLYACKYLKMSDRVLVQGFDTFEGMPEKKDYRDSDLIVGKNWQKGQFEGNYEKLYEYCKRRYNNFQLHKGLFENTITEAFTSSLYTNKPVLIWLDADFYHSTVSVFDKLIDFIPSGCVIYFDEPELNFGSTFTGEAKVIHDINNGKYGDGIELIPDIKLSLNSKRVYRIINMNSKIRYKAAVHCRAHHQAKQITNDSPLP